jgi:methylthioribose-1-phosphate isomerase
MKLPVTLEWVGGLDGHARLVDQTRLPGEFVHIECTEPDQIIQAIRVLAVRGAPAIGVAGAFGVVLCARRITGTDPAAFLAELEKSADSVARARPTAVNLTWAVDRMLRHAREMKGSSVQAIKEGLLEQARVIHREDEEICRRLGEVGRVLITDGDSVLTHCNAGSLATVKYGTALSLFYSAQEAGTRFQVFADETRPLLQGSRLTAWELLQAGIDVTLITDNMAGHSMRLGKINKVVVGADRIARNGDVANKIGTFSVAVLARHHGLPFYVVAPTSTFDLTLASGAEIPIEERAPEEVRQSFGRDVAPEGVKVFNPAFDVTPAEYVTAIVTEKGIIEKPDEERVLAVVTS